MRTLLKALGWLLVAYSWLVGVCGIVSALVRVR